MVYFTIALLHLRLNCPKLRKNGENGQLVGNPVVGGVDNPDLENGANSSSADHCGVDWMMAQVRKPVLVGWHERLNPGK